MAFLGWRLKVRVTFVVNNPRDFLEPGGRINCYRYGEAHVRILAAVADGVRWNILRLCGSRKRTQTELRSILGVSSSVLCRHIQILKRAGLIESARRGRTREITATESARTMLKRSLPLDDAHLT